MRKSITLFVGAVAASAFALLAGNAQGQILYSDSTTFAQANYNYGSLGPAVSAGNEVVLAGSSAEDLITTFIFQYDFIGAVLPTGHESADLRFYANNGPDGTPGTLLYNSGALSLGSLTLGATENLDQSQLGGGVEVPQTFTWTVSFSDLPLGDNAGLALYNPPTVGTNSGLALYSANGGATFSLITTTPPAPPLEFGVVMEGSPVAAAPDSFSLPISLVAILAGFIFVKRFTR